MAYALVSLGSVVQSTIGGSITTLAFGQSPTAGNHLICWWSGDGSNSFPSVPSGWTNGKLQSGSACAGGFFYKLAAGGDTAPTFATKGSDVQTALLAEFSGNQNPIVLGHNPGTSGTSSPITASAGAADTSATCLYIATGTVFYSTSTATNTLTLSFNNGASAVSTTNGGTNVDQYAFAYGFATSDASAISIMNTFTATNTVTGAMVGGASFLPAIVSAPPPVDAVPLVVNQSIQRASYF